MSLKYQVYTLSIILLFGSFLFFLCLWEFIYIILFYVYGIFSFFYCMFVYLFVFLLCKMFGALLLLFFNYKVASMLAA